MGRIRETRSSRSLAALPGATAHSVLLTLLTVALAALTGWSEQEALVRPLFYALLFAFFRATSARYPYIRELPMRLVETGFLVLALGSAASAALFVAYGDATGWIEQLRLVLDRGAIFLLGLVLLAYGLMLWIPVLLENHHQLENSFAHSQDQLQLAESARRDLEQRMLAQHRLTILGELAAGVAHDLRNPLTIVKGAADSLLRKARSPETVIEHSTVILRSVEKADRTISALLDLGRPRRSERTNIALEPVVAEVLALLQIEGRRRGLRFEAAIGGLQAHADSEPLVQILMNLLLNAAQASADKSCITVRARRCRHRDQHWVAIAIDDRGSGLPAAVRGNLFTPFFTTRRGGTGLGLLSCRRLCTELGGALQLYPRHRGGARALVLLPAATAAAAPAPAPAPVVVADGIGG